MKSGNPSADVEFRWGVRIPMRDGIHLNATLYMPAGLTSPLPCICTLTPYVSDTYHAQGVYFSTHGLPFLLVDVRGRGNSEGQFHPLIQEGRDGHDVVEWLAQQPYCNGRVGMWGGSYAGYCQWAAGKEHPPHLATIVPAAAPYLGVDFPMRNNIFYPYLIQWVAYTSGHTSQAQLFADTGFWSAQFRKWHQSGRPFRDLDSTVGVTSPSFQEWLGHPEADTFWDSHNPTPSQYSALEIPILTITGAYDDDQPGALRHYREHLKSAAPEAAFHHYLIIGPWDHAGTRSPAREFGGARFGAASMLDLQELHLEWYAWTMQGGPRPAFLEKSVAYYVTGAERWRYADALDTITEREQVFYLGSLGCADDVFKSGSLTEAPAGASPDVYTYDPGDLEGLEVDAEMQASGGSLVDQRLTLALIGKQLVYHSAPFGQDTEISGFFRLSAWLAIDCPDTDFYVSIHEIASDGSSFRLSTDAMRARYREDLRRANLIRTEEPLLYEFKRFTFVARQLKRGHRLRLVIAPIGRIIEGTFVQRNFNSGGVVSEESVRDARVVTVRLFHDADHPSALYMPLGHSEAAEDLCASEANFIRQRIGPE